MIEETDKQAIKFLIRLWLFVKAQYAHIVLILIVNVCFGALGFVVPIAIEYAVTLSFAPALQKQLNAAGAYTFAIAFLASSVSLVAAEYLDRNVVAEYRHSKVLLSTCAAVIIVFCAVFSGYQTARSLEEVSKTTEAHLKRHGSQVRESPRGLNATPESFESVPTVAASGLSVLDHLQVWTTLIAILVGLLLFFVFQYQAPNMQSQLAKYTDQTKVEVDSIKDGLEIGRR